VNWLDRLRKLDSESACQCQPCQPCQNNPTGRETCGVVNLPVSSGTVGTVGTGTSSTNEPAADAPGHVWAVYFDSQASLINEDLAAEGTTLNRVLASMRPKRRRRSQEEVREARWCRAYLADFTARATTPLAPCACGNVAFYQLVGDCRWRCRSCELVTARARVRWFVLDPALAKTVQQVREVFPDVVAAAVRARRRWL
jgi:hypothetical protein